MANGNIHNVNSSGVYLGVQCTLFKDSSVVQEHNLLLNSPNGDYKYSTLPLTPQYRLPVSQIYAG